LSKTGIATAILKKSEIEKRNLEITNKEKAKNLFQRNTNASRKDLEIHITNPEQTPTHASSPV